LSFTGTHEVDKFADGGLGDMQLVGEL